MGCCAFGIAVGDCYMHEDVHDGRLKAGIMPCYFSSVVK